MDVISRVHALKVVRSPPFETSIYLLVGAGLQVASFVLVARGLGVVQFGLLMIMSGVTQLGSEIVSLGAGEALIRRVARRRAEHGPAFGHALILTFATFVPVSLACLATAALLLPTVPMAVAAVFVVGELLGIRFAALSEHAFLSVERVAAANRVRIFQASWRLAAVVVAVYLLDVHALEIWMLVQGTITVAVGSTCLWVMSRTLGSPVARLHPSDIRFGALVTVTQVGRVIQFSMDRIILGIVSPPAVVGIYSAAMRAVQFAMIPMQAVMRNLLARFFREGIDGISATRAFARRNVLAVLVAGLGAGVALLVAANFLEPLLGAEFRSADRIVQGLALVPLLQGLQYLLADALSAADCQGVRTTISGVGSVVFILALGGLAASYGVWGAVAATYLYQVAMIFSYVVSVETLTGRTSKTA
jgi:O-antigen/teichoic acid export membrane protein